MPKDYSNQNLRGKNFRGQDLTDADFTGADIRGANFKNATLTRVKFVKAKAGFRFRGHILSLLISLPFSFLLGVLFAYSGALTAFVIKEFIYKDILKKSIEDNHLLFLTVILCLIYLVTLIVSICRDKFYSVASAVSVSGAFAVAVTFAVSASGSVTGAISGAVAGSGTGIILFILSFYMAWQLCKTEDEQFATLRQFVLWFGSLFGTNFKHADLTDANFSDASLKHICFPHANTTRTSWSNAKYLKFAYVKGTILQHWLVRELLVTGMGKNQSFKGLNLKGAYLANANLENADFTEADLSDANLQSAILVNANLTKTQMLGVNLKWANLTGACLESWNIDSTTILDGAVADYVYLIENKQERRPASGFFGEGEFAKLFQEVLTTVDFIFKNGIDWKAFMLSFDKVRENIRIESENQDISIQSIANKGDGVFVVKVNVPPQTDKAEFHNNFKLEYENNLRLIEEKYKMQLEFKEKEISIYREKSIEFREIINILSQKPIEIKTEAKIMRDENRTVNARDITGSTVNLGEISGNVTNTVNQIPPDHSELKELLKNLQNAIETSEELKPEDKADALEEVKDLAKSGENPNLPENQKQAGKSLRMLGRIIAGVPKATVFVGELEKLSAAIGKFFGL